MPPHMAARSCPYVVGYQREPAGSDVADPRIRCGKPATEQIDDDLWACPEHATIYREEAGQAPAG